MKARSNKRSTEPPSSIEENNLCSQGYRFIAGIDEAGRGALAGPVVAAAVILPPFPDFPWLKSVADSKQVPPRRRESLYHLIWQQAIAVSVGVIDSGTIDSVGILSATRLAMCLAVERLPCSPDFLLIDCLTLPQLSTPQKPIIRGDRLCLSIACASIVAKVTRDRIMVELDQLHPGYGFAEHKGYGTKHHLSCLRHRGPSPVHRYSFTPVRQGSLLP